MSHITVKATDLKVGDVLCPYGNLHFHYTVTELKHWPTISRIGVSMDGRYVDSVHNLREFQVFEG